MANILPCSFDTVLVNFKYCYQYNSPVFDYHPKYNHNWPNYILKKKVLKYGWGSMYHGNKANISQIIKILTYHISLHDANYEAQWSKKGNSDWLQSLQIPSLLESESEVTQSYLTLCSPMDCSLPGSSIHGIFQARILEWVAISFSRGSSRPRDWTLVSCIVSRRFTVWATREIWGKVRWGEVAQSCPTPCDPLDCSLPGSSVHGILQGSLVNLIF